MDGHFSDLVLFQRLLLLKNLSLNSSFVAVVVTVAVWIFIIVIFENRSIFQLLFVVFSSGAVVVVPIVVVAIPVPVAVPVPNIFYKNNCGKM